MVQSKAGTVEAYIQEVPGDRRDVLKKFRALCLKVLAGYKESMTYGMPSYGRAGEEIEIAFASQKHYISLYILRTAILDKHREELSHLDLGKSCVRYRKLSQIDWDWVTKVLLESRQSSDNIC